jgi:hypothetical protein
MTTEEIRNLLESTRESDLVSASDYQRLRAEEWRCLSVAFFFCLFGFTALTSRDMLPTWGILAILTLFLGGATIFAVRGFKCRKACAMFERFCPRSVDELDVTLLDSQNQQAKDARHHDAGNTDYPTR